MVLYFECSVIYLGLYAVCCMLYAGICMRQTMDDRDEMTDMKAIVERNEKKEKTRRHN